MLRPIVCHSSHAAPSSGKRASLPHRRRVALLPPSCQLRGNDVRTSEVALRLLDHSQALTSITGSAHLFGSGCLSLSPAFPKSRLWGRQSRWWQKRACGQDCWRRFLSNQKLIHLDWEKECTSSPWMCEQQLAAETTPAETASRGFAATAKAQRSR